DIAPDGAGRGPVALIDLCVEGVVNGGADSERELRVGFELVASARLSTPTACCFPLVLDSCGPELRILIGVRVRAPDLPGVGGIRRRITRYYFRDATRNNGLDPGFSWVNRELLLRVGNALVDRFAIQPAAVLDEGHLGACRLTGEEPSEREQQG